MKPEELEIKQIAYAELREIERFIGLPKPPTYSFTGAGGAKAVRRHDETTLQDEADLEAWEKYQAEWRAFIERRDMFVVGLAVTNCPEVPQEWVEEKSGQVWSKLPDNQDELRGYYVFREICKTPAEYNALVERIMTKSGFISKEEVDAKVASFRDKKGRSSAKNSS